MVSNKKNVIIAIMNRYSGFWLSIAKLLSSDYNVILVTKDHVAKEAFINISDLEIELKNDFFLENTMDNLDIIKEVCAREKKYSKTFSMIMSLDRGLGKGYLFNADRHPNIFKSWWSHEKKLKHVLKDFLFWEYIVEKYTPVIILSHNNIKVLSPIARYYEIRYLSMLKASYANRYMWVENEYRQNKELIQKVKDNVRNFTNSEDFTTIDDVVYIQDSPSKHVLSQFSPGFLDAFKKAAYFFLFDLYRVIRKTYSKESYSPWAWIPSQLRKPLMYKYFKRYGKKNDGLDKKYRIVYFSFHQEPEAALGASTPEFNNSSEIIAWVSKSLMADTLIVVKEHKFNFGIRSKHFYDTLRKINNVVLAHPEISSWDWIKISDMVVVLGGTVGIEAVYFDKPVLCYSKYHAIKGLPTVRYVNSFDSTNEAIKELLSIPPNDIRFRISKESLYRAQMDATFEIPGLEKVYKSREFHMDLAKLAIECLGKEYNL